MWMFACLMLYGLNIGIIGSVTGLEKNGSKSYVLKRGAVLNHIGEVSFSKDNMIVILDIFPMRNFVSQMLSAKSDLDNILKYFNESQLTESQIKLFFQVLSEDVFLRARKLMNEVLDQINPLKSHREKRGLFNIGGSLLNMLFGVATEEQVNNYRENVNKFVATINHNAKILNESVVAVNNQARAINALNVALYQVRNVLSDKLKRESEVRTLITLATISLQSIQEIHDHFLQFLDDLQLAMHGIITSSLIPPHQLKSFIQSAKLNYNFKPIYDFHDLFFYYKHIKISVVDFHLLLDIPFDIDKSDYQIVQIKSFPTVYKDKSVLNVVQWEYVIFDEKENRVILLNEKELNECINVNHFKYICDYTRLVTYPMVIEMCEVEMIFKDLYNNCVFVEYKKKLPFVSFFKTFIGFYFPERTALTIECELEGKKKSEYKDVLGEVMIPNNCQLSSPIISTRRTRVGRLETDIEIPPNLLYKSSHLFQLRTQDEIRWEELKNVSESVTSEAVWLTVPIASSIAVGPVIGCLFLTVVVIVVLKKGKYYGHRLRAIERKEIPQGRQEDNNPFEDDIV